MSEAENEYQIRLKNMDKTAHQVPKEVVIIPILNVPVFPGMIVPIVLTEEKFTPELDRYLLKPSFVALNLVKSDVKGEGHHNEMADNHRGGGDDKDSDGGDGDSDGDGDVMVMFWRIKRSMWKISTKSESCVRWSRN